MSNNIKNGSTSVLQIMSNLTYGELSQYAVGGANQGQVLEKDYPRVMSAINRGVNEIQKDLSVHEGSIRLRLIEGVLTYPIHSQHSMVTGTHVHKFVDDSTYEPFEDDILRILRVYDKGGTELPINEHNLSNTIYVPAHNVIQHPFVIDQDILGVVYSRFSKAVTVTTAEEAASTYLAIPDPTLSALYAYVASIMSAGITTAQEISDSDKWRAEYEARIAKLKYNPATPPESYSNTKLTDNGFV